MAVGAEWAVRNLGIAPPAEAPVGAAAAPPGGGDLRREVIDYDSESPQGDAFRALAGAAPGGLANYVDVDWPAGLAPVPGSAPRGASLPKADVLIVTWTMDEGHALSRVLTPGADSRDDWKPYTKNFAAIAKEMRAGCPAREYGRLGTFWTTRIGARRVTLFKSDSHMSQDGPKLPNADVWRQIIADAAPTWVITTGTGGGIGPAFEVGDVIVSPYVAFDCQKDFKRLDGQSYTCPTPAPTGRFAQAAGLFSANAGSLPKDNTRAPRIVRSRSGTSGILTTDFFGFDNTADTYGLEGKGDLSEMGDAVLGLVCQELGPKAPAYVVVRNVSDPQIDATGETLAQQRKLAADIYKGYGRWSTVCSAITCWAIVAGL